MTTITIKIEAAGQIDRAIDLFGSEDYDSAIAQASSLVPDTGRVRSMHDPFTEARDILDLVVENYWNIYREETPAMVWFKETHLQPKR